MLGILFRVEVEPKKRQAFIDFIKWDVQVARHQEKGTVRFDLYQDPKDKNAFFVYEAYVNEAAFKKHQEGKPYKHWEKTVMPTMLVSFQRIFKGKAVVALMPIRLGSGSSGKITVK